MHREDIKKRSEELAVRLKGRTHEDGLVVAARASLRALPTIWNWADASPKAESWQITALPALWANLSAWLVAMRPSENNLAAAGKASGNCGSFASILDEKMEADEDFGGNSAAHAATFAAAHAGKVYFPDPKKIPHLAALYASCCGGAGVRASKAMFLDAALEDCTLIESGTAALSRPLWHGQHNPMEAEWNALRAPKAKPKTSFLARLFGESRNQNNKNIWQDWYHRALDGRDQPHLAELEKLSWRIGRQS